ncbi:uncharacterized protein ASCRUDRAFT_70539 [Ascoidea rubescens DSM 1968]|uniref:Uncharacterized protein n=1 Tax=Ascoidea rubescens DSM 1968 TaxID=1344418 RepID=A0A1D2VGC9_9ASCO|nr:hypothetical protein ASCRUDRAFT_70539 [Ascoidea rubescens DSM 1968]ODV60642.1 hypothetical protein ASCRUDRAFT_70539 [Ascoidea rubescens DSM 1968]
MGAIPVSCVEAAISMSRTIIFGKWENILSNICDYNNLLKEFYCNILNVAMLTKLPRLSLHRITFRNEKVLANQFSDAELAATSNLTAIGCVGLEQFKKPRRK